MVRSFLVTSLEALPLLLTIKEVCRVYRISEAVARRDLQAGTFRPAPWDRGPYRWTRDQIEEDLKKPRRRSRQAKATLLNKRRAS